MKPKLMIIPCLLLSGAALVFGQAPTKKVSRAEALASVVTKVAPVYPAIAKQMKMEGTAELEATVTEEGTVSQVAIISGNPLLTKAGVEALKQWKFTPFKDNGKPVTAVAPIAIVFRLGGQQ